MNILQPHRKWVTYGLLIIAVVLAVIAGRRSMHGANLMAQTQAHHAHEAELKNEDGTWKYTNLLAKETSPYLLQHAHNPVDWNAWGAEAFELSRTSGKPIFLSIGYSTCYWCHVMERQVFENPQIAALMNEHFVNIKVDREERPDVDDIYMMATQLIHRSGGWPMSVFLTPPGAGGEDDLGLKPFYAGTYFPPQQMGQMPGFPQVIEQISGAWRDRREDVLKSAEQVAQIVSEQLKGRDERGELDEQIAHRLAEQTQGRIDTVHGGFGAPPGRPNKFPMPAEWSFLIKVYQTTPDDGLWQAIAHTLDRMARGGMYDHVGGGFHRYSTDEKWLVPHFEKMLYDNGQLVELYCDAHDVRPREGDGEFYTRVVREICDYVLREMTDQTGAFWSAQDAEVNAREGGNYVWTAEEVEQVIGDGGLAKLAKKMYGLDLGTNFRDPHDPSADDVNVIYLPQPLHELAVEEDISQVQLLERKTKIDQLMLAVRDQRDQPATDDKVIVSWNGMMIAGLARAGRTLGEPEYTVAAARAAEYILEHMRTEDGGLYRTMRQGRVKIHAFLEDYAYFVHGLIELHRSDAERRWLDAAKELMEKAAELFAAETGGYYDTLADQADLFVRTRTTYDGAIPSGNSQMVHNLVDLFELTGEPQYLEQVVADLDSFSASLREQGAGMVHMLHSLLRAAELSPQPLSELAAARGPGGAQPMGGRPQHLKVKVEPAELVIGPVVASATIHLTIEEGFHLNAHGPGTEGLVATAIKLADGEGLKLDVDYPAGEAKQYPFGDTPISVYEGQVELKVTVTAEEGVKECARPKLMMTYQMCTDDKCMLPATIELPLTLKVRR